MDQSPKLLRNIFTIISKYLDVHQKLIDKQSKKNSSFSNDPLQLNKLFFKFFNKIFSDPDTILKYQISFFKGQLATIEAIFSNQTSQNLKTDKRFKDNIWQEHCIFSWLKEAYFTYSKWIDSIIAEFPKDDFSVIEFRRLNFIIKQFVDAISPSNFPATNPEVIRAFFDTAGESLIRGLDNLIKDIEHSKQSFLIQTNDNSKFDLGVNIAITEGKVVFQNKIIQWIPYKPLRDKHYSVPILIVSPFINKYYIMDLQPENSLVKWLLEQNYNVFLISWVNPDESLSEKNFSDYMLEGPIAALDYLSEKLNIHQVNTLGYCIGGTLLASTLGYMKAINDKRIKSASFLTTLIDFAEAGDLSIFVDDYFVNEVSHYLEESGGFLDGSDMSTTFNLLRSNDMIWPFYINNYLLGKEPFPFNLLYWNSDSIRMPKNLHLFYLKNMYKDNLLKAPGGITLNNQAIDISKVDIPCFAMAAKGDHIVPWQNAFNSAKLFSGPVTFALAESGHVAGVINHPDRNKYCYWINQDNFKQFKNSEEWLSNVKEQSGSWWIYWNEWAKEHSGELVLSKAPEVVNDNIIESAPGSYVKVKY